MSKDIKISILLLTLSGLWLSCLWLSFDLITHSSSLFLGGFVGWQKFLWWLVSCSLTAGLFVVASLLLERSFLVTLAALPAVGLGTFFGVQASFLAAVFLLLFPWWAKDIRQILSETLNFRKTSLYANFLETFYTAICAVLAVMVYFLISSYVAVNGFTLPEAWKSKVMRPISNVVVQRLKDQIEAEFKAKNIPLPAEGVDQLLLKELQETLFEEGTTRQKFVPQSLNQAVEADLIKQLEEKLQQMLEPYETWMVIGLAALVFFTLRFFSGVVVGLGKVLLACLFWLASAIGFMVFKTETRQVQVPSF